MIVFLNASVVSIGAKPLSEPMLASRYGFSGEIE